MVFVINNLKYDTDKMELISEKCKHFYKAIFWGTEMWCDAGNVRLWRSRKGRWLLTYKAKSAIYGQALSEYEAKNILVKYDLDAYEKMFLELEEA